jgi:ribonuclease P protein component
MIASKYRIPKQFFPQVMKSTHSTGTYLKVILSAPISKHTNFSAVISKKYVKLANDRNYIKRVIYQFFMENIDLLPKNKAIVCLFIKKIPENLDKYELITKDLEKIFKIKSISKNFLKKSYNI